MQKATLAKIALTAAVLFGGGGFLVYSSVSHAQHYKMVDDLVSNPLEQWKDRELKVHGFVEAGTIIEGVVNQETRRTFVLQKNGKKIRIFSKGPAPDTFKDASEVVATGRLMPASQMTQLAADICANPIKSKDKANDKPTEACPVHADGEQTWVVESTELMAKCPSKYDGAASNKLDTQFK